MVHVRLVGCLHHHPQQRFGAAGPHQHPAAAGHRRLGRQHGLLQGLAPGPAGAAQLIGHGDIHQLLGIGRKTFIHPIGQGAPLARHQGGHLQGGEQPVATHAVVRRQDVARLLSPQGGAVLLHGGVDVLIAHGGALQQATAPLPGPFKAQVAHHRGHDAVLGQAIPGHQLLTPEVEHLITIHHPAITVYRQHAVGIAIKGKAHGGTPLQHRSPQRFQVGAAAGLVDAAAVGAAVQHGELGPQLAEQLLATAGG